MPLFDSDTKAELFEAPVDLPPALLEVTEMRVLALFAEDCRCRQSPLRSFATASGCPHGCAGGQRVALRGYAGEPHAPDYEAMDAQLKRALQLTVAGIAEKALASNGNVKRERDLDRTTEYFARETDSISFTDTALLRPFDDRAPLYSLP